MINDWTEKYKNKIHMPFKNGNQSEKIMKFTNHNVRGGKFEFWLFHR